MFKQHFGFQSLVLKSVLSLQLIYLGCLKKQFNCVWLVLKITFLSGIKKKFFFINSKLVLMYILSYTCIHHLNSFCVYSAIRIFFFFAKLLLISIFCWIDYKQPHSNRDTLYRIQILIVETIWHFLSLLLVFDDADCTIKTDIRTVCFNKKCRFRSF